VRYGRQTVLGISRIIWRTAEEHLPWLPNQNQGEVQAHDEPGHGTGTTRDNYFRAPHFYCVETIAVPCGVVIAWTKFPKAKSPTNILNFLQSVYPTPELRPDYVCIDKACLVLRTAIANGTWNTWKATTRFIVDSYHYINHEPSHDARPIICAELGVILLHSMVLNPILFRLNMIEMDFLIINEHSILR
jgi:hypothetical protein